MIMITPNKHTEIKYSVLYVAGLILKEIMKSGVVPYCELKESIVQLLGKEVSVVFPKSLSFLYLMNKIDYKEDIDSFIYIN